MCSSQKELSYTFEESIVEVYVGRQLSVDDVIARMGSATFAHNIPVPWFAVVRKGLLLMSLTESLRGPPRQKVLMELCDHYKLSFTNGKNSQLNDTIYATRFFKTYPVMLLQWGKDLRKTPKSMRYILRHQKQIEAFLNKDPIVKDFYKGM